MLNLKKLKFKKKLLKNKKIIKKFEKLFDILIFIKV
jgi:hypothetical protein